MSEIKTYLVWIFKQRGREDNTGKLARKAFADTEWDGKQRTLKALTNGSEYSEMYRESLIEFRAWVNQPIVSRTWRQNPLDRVKVTPKKRMDTTSEP